MTDDELREHDRRARERLAAARKDTEPMSSLAGLTKTPPAAVARVKCPRCASWALASDIVDGQCGACRDRARERREFFEMQCARIPESYKERLATSPPTVRAWTFTNPPPFIPDDSIHAANRWLNGLRGGPMKRTLSIFGHVEAGSSSTGAGKSTLAACVAASAAENGQRIRWVHATDLVDDDVQRARFSMDAIRATPFVVIDGLGKEFGNTKHLDSYESDKARAVMVRVFTHIHQSKGQRFVLTFDMPVDVLWKDAYDAGLMRRVMNEDFADVITLRRNGKVRVLPGGRPE